MIYRFIFVLCCSVLTGAGLCPEACAQSETFQYKAPKNAVQYQIKITVDTPSEVTTYQGQTIYKGVPSSADKVALRFSGRLDKSTKSKRRAGRPGASPFGGPPPPAGFPFGPLTASTALQQTNAQIELTPQGKFLSLSGESQIPLPLGHLSLLVFDTLPAKTSDTWTSENGVLLGEDNESNSPFPGSPFPGSPFGRRSKADTTSSGSESATYKVTSRDGHRVNIEKQYKLDSPNSDPPFTFAGSGPVVFDSEIGMFASAELKYELKVSPKNVEIRIPVTIEYRILSQEEIVEQAAKKKGAAEAAMEKGMASARARFAHMSQEEIAAIYKNGGEVPPTGLVMTPEMDIPVGLIAQNKWSHDYRWSALRVIEILANNLIKIQSIKSKKFYTRNRNTLSLAPDFVEQPDVSEETVAALHNQVDIAETE